MASYRRTNDGSSREIERSTAGASGGRDHENCLIDLHDHSLVFVVRTRDAMPAIYLADGVTAGHAALLLEMMATKMREEYASDVKSAQ